MDIAVLSDIHGNYIAFKECVEYALNRGIHTFIFLGDYVAEFPYPQKTMEMLYDMQEKYDCYFIRGNKEDYWLNRRYDENCEWKEGNRTVGAMLYSYAHLTDRDIDFYKSQPICQEFTVAGASTLMACHGSPQRNNQKMLPDNEETRKVMEACVHKYILFGHTHKQGFIEHNGKVALNPGSVGVSIYSAGKAQFMILHQKQEEWIPEFLSLEYDKERVMQEMQESGLEKEAPYWTQVTRHLMHTGEVSHEFILKRACALCEAETGTSSWHGVPDRYWIKVIAEYLPIREITLGKSGARVYELIDHRILKVVFRDELQDDTMWAAYEKEALFYEWCASSRNFARKAYNDVPYRGSNVENTEAFLPKIYINIHTDNEIFIIMKQYQSLEREQLNDDILTKIMDALVQVHGLELPEFLPKEERRPVVLEEEVLEECMTGWQSILTEHSGAFEESALTDIRENINAWNKQFFAPETCFTHGDFHFENLLADVEGNIVVVDWQNCSEGNASGDISFLLSRLSADGYVFEQDKIIEMYCRSSQKMGFEVSPKEIERQMCLANLNTSFRFWHIYLHGSTEERVRGIYDKMVEDARSLSS